MTNYGIIYMIGNEKHCQTSKQKDVIMHMAKTIAREENQTVTVYREKYDDNYNTDVREIKITPNGTIIKVWEEFE